MTAFLRESERERENKREREREGPRESNKIYTYHIIQSQRSSILLSAISKLSSFLMSLSFIYHHHCFNHYM